MTRRMTSGGTPAFRSRRSPQDLRRSWALAYLVGRPVRSSALSTTIRAARPILAITFPTHSELGRVFRAFRPAKGCKDAGLTGPLINGCLPKEDFEPRQQRNALLCVVCLHQLVIVDAQNRARIKLLARLQGSSGDAKVVVLEESGTEIVGFGQDADLSHLFVNRGLSQLSIDTAATFATVDLEGGPCTNYGVSLASL
jgi:hypothetical protein